MMKFGAEHENAAGLVASNMGGSARMPKKVLEQTRPRCVLTSEFCCSVFDILRFLLVIAEVYRGDRLVLAATIVTINIPL
jgi:hypothetical protein